MIDDTVSPSNVDPAESRLSILEVIVRVAGFIAVGFAGQIAGVLAASAFAFEHLLILAAFSSTVGGVAANWAALHVFHRLPLSAAGLHRIRAASHIATGLLLGAGAAAGVVGILVLAGWSHWERIPWQGPVPAASVVILAAVAAFGEELLFRGYGLQILIARFGALFPILVSSALFGLLHAANPSAGVFSILNTALWGGVLGYALWRSRGLWLPAALHLGWNVTQLALGATLSGFKMEIAGLTLRSSAPAYLSGGAYGPEASFVTTVAAGAILLFLWKGPIAPARLDLLDSQGRFLS